MHHSVGAQTQQVLPLAVVSCMLHQSRMHTEDAKHHLIPILLLEERMQELRQASVAIPFYRDERGELRLVPRVVNT